MMRKAVFGLLAAVGLSCCGNPYYRMPEECYANNLVHDNSNGVDFFVPEEYHGDITGYTNYMVSVAESRLNSRNLREVIFYDSSLCELSEDFEDAVGITNSVDTIWMNDPKFFIESFAGKSHRIDFFYTLSDSINKKQGVDMVFGHEYAHILFQHELEEMEGNDFKGLASDSFEVSDDTRRHYIIDRYGHFLELMYLVFTKPEHNRYFERDLLPLARGNPDLVVKVRREVDLWGIDSLYYSEPYHDNQLDFFIERGAISPGFRHALSKDNLFTFMESLLEAQKANANAELDEIEDSQ